MGATLSSMELQDFMKEADKVIIYTIKNKSVQCTLLEINFKMRSNMDLQEGVQK
jgi:hypothetical protein